MHICGIPRGTVCLLTYGKKQNDTPQDNNQNGYNAQKKHHSQRNCY